MGQTTSSQFQLAFRSLFNAGRGYAFPCDEHGQVDMDAMSETTRNYYLFARAMVGRDLRPPAVERVQVTARHDPWHASWTVTSALASAG